MSNFIFLLPYYCLAIACPGQMQFCCSGFRFDIASVANQPGLSIEIVPHRLLIYNSLVGCTSAGWISLLWCYCALVDFRIAFYCLVVTYPEQLHSFDFGVGVGWRFLLHALHHPVFFVGNQCLSGQVCLDLHWHIAIVLPLGLILTLYYHLIC